MEYQASKKQPLGSGERRVIRAGKAWMRWLMIPVVLFSIAHIYEHPTNWIGAIVLAIAVGLFFVFKRARRIEHDDVNLYIIRDKKVQVVPFTQINSIKRSAAKVNGERFWIIRYQDGDRERKIRYFRLFFNKEFQQAVKEQNPAVVIWTHPHFNH
jgi:hypothetical protein